MDSARSSDGTGPSDKGEVNHYAELRTSEEMLRRYVHQSSHILSQTPRSDSVVVQQPFNTTAPYPGIFKKGMYTTEGYTVEEGRGGGSDHVEKVSVLTQLESNKGIACALESLHEMMRNINPKKFFQYYDSGGLTVEDFKDVGDNLSRLAGLYSGGEME